MDERGLARSRDAVQEIAASEGDPAICVPLEEDYDSELNEMVGLTYLFASQKVSGIVQKHFLHSRVENNARHGAFVPRVCPSPRPVRIGEINLDTVHSFGFIFLFGLKYKLLENGVIASDNTSKNEGR